MEVLKWILPSGRLTCPECNNVGSFLKWDDEISCSSNHLLRCPRCQYSSGIPYCALRPAQAPGFASPATYYVYPRFTITKNVKGNVPRCTKAIFITYIILLRYVQVMERLEAVKLQSNQLAWLSDIAEGIAAFDQYVVQPVINACSQWIESNNAGDYNSTRSIKTHDVKTDYLNETCDTLLNKVINYHDIVFCNRLDRLFQRVRQRYNESIPRRSFTSKDCFSTQDPICLAVTALLNASLSQQKLNVNDWDDFKSNVHNVVKLPSPSQRGAAGLQVGESGARVYYICRHDPQEIGTGSHFVGPSSEQYHSVPDMQRWVQSRRIAWLRGYEHRAIEAERSWMNTVKDVKKGNASTLMEAAENVVRICQTIDIVGLLPRCRHSVGLAFNYEFQSTIRPCARCSGTMWWPSSYQQTTKIDGSYEQDEVYEKELRAASCGESAVNVYCQWHDAVVEHGSAWFSGPILEEKSGNGI